MRTGIRMCKMWIIAIATFLACGMPALGMQSLGDVARKEAERRTLLERQGIVGKVIQWDAVRRSTNGNLTLSQPSSSNKTALKEGSSAKDQKSLNVYRKTLRKLRSSIREDETRLKLLRERLRAERWAPPRAGRMSGQGSTADSQARLQERIENLQIELKKLRQERTYTYRSGRRAGFLPGELNGKGIIP